MASLAYSIMTGILGIAMVGAIYAVMDQVIMGSVWNLGLDLELNADYLNIYGWGWYLIPVLITFTFIIGNIATSHQTKND